jgi:hypothetical protein
MAGGIDFNFLRPNSALFLAEGASEVGLVRAILESVHGVNADIFDVRGEKNLKTVLLALSDKLGGWDNAIRSIGIVFDANEDQGSKMASITSALTQTGFEFDPGNLDENGICRKGNMPIGVFISPGNGGPGRIETMILTEIRSSSINECLDGFAGCVVARTTVNLSEKGLVQAYLGGRNAAHGIGVAFEKGVLDINHEAYARVRNMVRHLV